MIKLQAVEVTKLSLLLKVLEGENQQTMERQLKLFHERALPDLGNNIKCGNSLIGPDFYDKQQMTFLDEEERYRINAFDWNAEFPEIMKCGGFHAVIGNPPYGASLSGPEERYLSRRFALQQYQLDTYLVFMEGGLGLLKARGLLGLIIPNTWLLNLTGVRMRKYLFSASQVESVVHYSRRVFATATVDTEVVVIRKRPPAPSHSIDVQIIDRGGRRVAYRIPQSRWTVSGGAPVNILERPDVVALADKLRAMAALEGSLVVTQGAKPFQVGKGKPAQTRTIVDEKPFVSHRRVDRTFRPLLRGSLINRYTTRWNRDYWISFGDWLAEPRYSARHDAPVKIVVRQTGDSLVATLDRSQFVVRDNLYTIVPRDPGFDLRFALGLINSKLLNWYYQTVLNPEKGEALAQVKRGHLARLPLIVPDDPDPEIALRHHRMVELVERMLSVHKQLAAGKTAHEKTVLQREIETTDRQIDQLVYELYGLTQEEIKIVEEATK